MRSSRIFVSNLPLCTTEKDLRLLFQDYGYVDLIELKTKENLVDNSQSKLIAFVTLQVDENDAAYCVNDLSYIKLHGAPLKVSLAKESFLDRLKRERENTEQAKNIGQSTTQVIQSTSELLQRNHQNTRRTFAEDADFDDDDIAPELLISRKRAATSMQNGKIVIQNNFDATPLHVIEKATHKRQNNKQQLDGKCIAADEKRKKSLNNMQTVYKQQKIAIQQALAGLDGHAEAAKKIRFEASDEEFDESAIVETQPKKDLFADNDDNDDTDDAALALPIYKGKKGEKLVQMQSKQSTDPRFRISERFVDDENDDNAVLAEEQQTGIEEADNERNWQLGILQQVVGNKIDVTSSGAQSGKHAKKMLRYDPANEDHSKFLRQKQSAQTATEATERKPKVQQKQKQQQQRMRNSNGNDKNSEPGVSKEMFYVVSDSLQQALKTRGDGFSLLNMFGGGTTELTHARKNLLTELGNEKILVNKHEKHGIGMDTLNPFTYDSSDDDVDDNDEGTKIEEEVDTVQQTVKNQPEPAITKAEKSKAGKKVKIVVESFFMPRNDARLKEGAKFFKYKKEAENAENYEDVRNRLKLLIKTKITKSKKQLLASGVKKRKSKRMR